MLRKLNIKIRLGLFLGSLTLLLGIVGAINMLSDGHISDHIRAAEGYHYPLAINSMNLELWIERNLAIINAAALAGRKDLLAPLEDTELSLEKCFNNLRLLVHQSPELDRDQKALEQRYAEAKLIGLQWVDATLAENWEVEPKLSYKFTLLRLELEKSMSALKNTGVTGFTDSLNQISNDMQYTWKITLAVFVVGLMCFIILNFRLYRSIALPLQGLLQFVTTVRKDSAQLSQRVVVDSTNEIGQLGTAFNALLGDLERSQEKLKIHSAGLERLVDERTSELEQEKKALRESERYRKAIWDSTPSGIVIIDVENNRIVDANPFALKLMGHKQKDVIGRVCHRFICPAEKNKCPITDLGKTIDGSERRLVTIDGGEIPILKTVVPFKAQGKNLLIESFIDMAKLKKAQEKLKFALASAESANNAKSAFLANMSHELRTPLNHIIGFTELVVGKEFGTINEVQEEYLHDVLEASQHLLSLINDILDLSKVEAGKIEIDPSDVCIKDLLTGSLTMVKEKALKHGINLAVKIDAVPDIVEADERRLKQIMYNLLSNAVKFTPEGGKIEVGSKIGYGINTVDQPSDEKHLHVWVKDTGIGIDPQDLDLIFSPFEQVESSINRTFQGTGLGLALTKKMVELHRGHIKASSEGKNKGAVFEFTLPIHKTLETPIVGSQ